MTTNVSSVCNDSLDIVSQHKQQVGAASPSPPLPPPIPHITNNYISLQATVANLVLFTHKELRNILETLPATSSDAAKKRRLLDFIVKIRIQFIKVYVLTKWARVSKDISKTIDVVSWLNGQQNCFNNLVSTLFNIEKQLAGAKLRTPDIETALQVLTVGRPFQTSRNFFPQKKLSPTTILQTLHDLDILLSIRLALTEKLPPEFSRYKISDGRVTFFIDNSYQVQLGIADDSVKARFFFVDFKFDFPGAISPSPRTHHRLEMESNEILAKKGLVSFFEMLLRFTQNYKLSTYYNQVMDLQRGLYSEILVPRFQPDKSLVTIHYWPHYKIGSSYKNTINIGISKSKQIGAIWIRDNQIISKHGIEFGQTNNSVENLIQQFTSLHVRHLILAVFNSLSRILDYNSRSAATAGSSGSGNSNNGAPVLARSAKSITAQRAIYLQLPNRNNDSTNTATPSPQSPSAQTSTPNTPASLDGQQRDSMNEFFIQDQSNHEIITMISPEKLKIRLTGSRFTIFSIDKLTGKPILTNSTSLVSSVESAISEAQGRANTIADLLIKLRLASIQEDICNRARAAGWIAKPNIPIHSSVVRSKFPSDTRSIFCLRQSSWPDRWFLLVTLSTHGLPRWWITQMFMKEGTWNLTFTEEISTPQEDLDGSYSYAMLNDLNISTFARIRTEALRKELDRCKIRYRLVSSDSVPLPFPGSTNDKGTLPIAMFDVNSICESSSWAESTVFMRIDRSTESDEMVKVLIQGRAKQTLAIEAMPSKDPAIQFHPQKSIFYLTLDLKSSSIPLSMPSTTPISSTNVALTSSLSSSTSDSGDSHKHNSELITKVAEKFMQIENVVNHISLLRSLSLKIVSASMQKIIFEYGPSMTASISLIDAGNVVIKSENQSANKGTTSSSPVILLELQENSPHKIVEPLLQEMINVDGLLAVVWVLRKSLPLYLALQEITAKYADTGFTIKTEKSADGNNNSNASGIKNTTSSSTGNAEPPIIINIHSFTEFTIHFLRPINDNGGFVGSAGDNRGRVCIQLKVLKRNGRPLSVFVSEYFPKLPSQNPKLNGPIRTMGVDNNNSSSSSSPVVLTGSSQLVTNGVMYQPLIPLWTKMQPDVASAVPLQQGLSCHMNDIQLVMRKVHALILNSEAKRDAIIKAEMSLESDTTADGSSSTATTNGGINGNINENGSSSNGNIGEHGLVNQILGKGTAESVLANRPVNGNASNPNRSPSVLANKPGVIGGMNMNTGDINGSVGSSAGNLQNMAKPMLNQNGMVGVSNENKM